MKLEMIFAFQFHKIRVIIKSYMLMEWRCECQINLTKLLTKLRIIIIQLRFKECLLSLRKKDVYIFSYVFYSLVLKIKLAISFFHLFKYAFLSLLLCVVVIVIIVHGRNSGTGVIAVGRWRLYVLLEWSTLVVTWTEYKVM